MINTSESNSWEIGKLCYGIHLHIHAMFPYYVVYLLLANLQPGMPADRAAKIMGLHVIEIIILFATVLIHELGHSFMTIFIGGTVPKILLWPYGGLAYCAFDASPAKQLAVSCAGPAVHIPLYGAFYALQHYATTIGQKSTMALLFDISAKGMQIQKSLFFFNVFFPIYPLDGGKIFVCILKIVTNWTNKFIAKISIGVSMLIGIGMGIRFFMHRYLFGLFLLGWILNQVLGMLAQLNAGTINQHPMFKDFDADVIESEHEYTPYEEDKCQRIMIDGQLVTIHD